ncbi:SDR family NAD(P)-dependent oxidoreductase [Campylobacter cuniculorum]|uniref:Short chain dehydrogenase/reductase n=2 Tax=Campylobacter cuniculorum TaxID=374106 RepID=A0A1W6BWK1_9BACT|nr:SDR family oxidoreductase [Campylobacter cuniculorum]ARJ56486.1 short chain dehydrogenase/reductase [Campylobacter cuniculorum DSM 23162 = LMG 24588]QOR03969.1 SDR family oxidoreductase [Campylobacter cuniculorum]
MKECFKDKVVLITGAKQGIGLATAQEFAKVGAKVVLCDIVDMSEEVKELNDKHYQAMQILCDVSDEKQVAKMIAEIISVHKRLDCGFNNAGIQTPQKPMAQITQAEFDKTIAVDLKGVWNCMQYEIEQMLTQGGGCIVNTSSQGGITGFVGQAAYIACKHAVIGLTRTAALDYVAKNIRINAVLPGAILTPMAKDLIKRNPEIEKELLRDIPKGRLGEPKEIADAVMWLCSPYASFVEGAAICVDGGFTAH